ncbi:MAG TPA: EAL domain-containing protein [Devosia sp.]|nr:EAL domain-containing protein [Devosia sp.]
MQCYDQLRRIPLTESEQDILSGLVYIFIGLFSLAIAGGAYFGLTFTPIESFLFGLIALGFALILLQRRLHQRDLLRLEKSIQDLSRLLSTDAQAGKNLSQRLNAIADIEAEQRLEVLEGDMSVLGTVVRQLAESMADLEQEGLNKTVQPQAVPDEDDMLVPGDLNKPVEPVIPAEMLRQALSEDRLLHHIEPIITLPQRRTHGYDLVPRLMLEDGELAVAEDFMPTSAGALDLVAEIEALALVDAITFSRRAITAGDPVIVYAPLSLATLSNERETKRVFSLLDANKAVAKYICFIISESQWSELTGGQRTAVETMVKYGVRFSLSHVRSLRLNFSDLAEMGISTIRADTKRFIDQPATYTDFHTADIAAYVNRFEIDLIMTNVQTEQHVLTLLDDGIGLAQGPHLAMPGPMHSDFVKPGKAMPKPKLA